MPSFSFPEYGNRVVELTDMEISRPETETGLRAYDISKILPIIAEQIHEIKNAHEEALPELAKELNSLTRALRYEFPSWVERVAAHKIANLFQIAVDGFAERGLTHENNHYVMCICSRSASIRSGNVTTEAKLLGDNGEGEP